MVASKSMSSRQRRHPARRTAMPTASRGAPHERVAFVEAASRTRPDHFALDEARAPSGHDDRVSVVRVGRSRRTRSRARGDPPRRCRRRRAFHRGLCTFSMHATIARRFRSRPVGQDAHAALVGGGGERERAGRRRPGRGEAWRLRRARPFRRGGAPVPSSLTLTRRTRLLTSFDLVARCARGRLRRRPRPRARYCPGMPDVPPERPNR